MEASSVDAQEYVPSQPPLISEHTRQQISGVASLWTEEFPVKDAPSKEEIERAVQQWALTVPENFRGGKEEQLGLYLRGDLVIAPPLPIGQLLEMIAANTRLRVKKATVRKKPWERVVAPHWTIGIIPKKYMETIPVEIYCENLGQRKRARVRRAGDRVTRWKAWIGEKGLEVMPPYAYISAQAGGLVHQPNPRVLDKWDAMNPNSVTAFEPLEGEEFIPTGWWHAGRPILDGDEPDERNPYVLCRPWFGGELNF